MKHDVYLRCGGAEYRSWESLTVQKSMTALACTWRMTFNEKYSGALRDYWNIRNGALALLRVNGQVLAKGFMEDISYAWDDQNETLSGGGRDLIQDLVDCTHEGPTTEWFNASLETIVQDLCAPFALVTVKVAAVEGVAALTGKLFPKFTMSPGEKVGAAIAKLCKQRGVLAFSDGDGTLWLTTAGSEVSKDALVSGRPRLAWIREIGHPVKKGSITESNKDRFSKYTVKGQVGGVEGWDPNTPEGSASDALVSPQGESVDTAIPRYRPLTLIGESQGDAGQLQERANWEAVTRAGASRKATYTLATWLQRDGALFRPNLKILVKDKRGGLDGEYLIESCTYRLDLNGGTTLDLTVVHPDAFKAAPEETDAGGILGQFDINAPEPEEAEE